LRQEEKRGKGQPIFIDLGRTVAGVVEDRFKRYYRNYFHLIILSLFINTFLKKEAANAATPFLFS